MKIVVEIYRMLFARRIFYRVNRFVYRCSLRGIGVLNSENARVSGEDVFLEKYLCRRDGCVVFDVGANVGSYSRKIFQSCPSATVYAFEPHPVTFATLEGSVGANGFYPVNAAASDSNGVMELYDYAQNDGSSHASLHRDVIEGLHKQKAVTHQVNVVALGDFAAKQNIGKIDLLKIDTEGNELKVLLGMKNYIDSGMVDAIHFEFNEMNVSSRTYFRDFWNLLPNYDFFRLLPDGMVKIDIYEPDLCEIFAYQNIVALLKNSAAVKCS